MLYSVLAAAALLVFMLLLVGSSPSTLVHPHLCNLVPDFVPCPWGLAYCSSIVVHLMSYTLVGLLGYTSVVVLVLPALVAS
jgi:hypothetical protein